MELLKLIAVAIGAIVGLFTVIRRALFDLTVGDNNSLIIKPYSGGLWTLDQ